MQLPDALLAPLEVGLNRYLAEDEEALADLGKLRDRVIALRLRDLDLRFFMRLHPAGVQVSANSDVECDAEIETGLPTLARAILQPDVHQELTSSGAIRIEGDAELVQQFFNILRETDFDPEDWLSRYLGDVAAFRAGQFLRGLVDFGRRGFENLFNDSSRLLQPETGDLVAGDETRDWMDEVDKLRTAVDRIEARMTRLAERLHPRPKEA